SRLPALHPFPTRRSSDLSCGPDPRISAATQRVDDCRVRSPRRKGGPQTRASKPYSLDKPHSISAGSPRHLTAYGERRNGIRLTRSEEHTSELQSRVDIVC